MRARGISKENRAVLDFVIQYKTQYDGLSPSYREIGRALGLGQTTIRHHISWLVEYGLLDFGPNSHGLMVAGGSWQMRTVDAIDG